MFCIILHLSVSCLVRMPSLNLLQRRTYAQIHHRRTWIASPFTVFSASLAHVPCLALWHRVFYTFCSLARRWKYTHTHTHAFLKEGHGRFSRDLRLDGGCPTYCLLPPHSPQTGRVRSLPFCSLPASSVLSVVTEWHVHSCLLPPAAAYSKAHTSPSSQRFNFCHFNFLFRVGFGRLCHAVHKVDLLNNCSK